MAHENVGFGTMAIHGSHRENAFGALAPPIFQTSTFKFESAEQGGARFSGVEDGYMYTRLGNPTVTALEEKIALLEGGEGYVAFSSGMGAISGTMLTILSSGDHLIADKVLYGCTYDLFNNTFPRLGIEVEFIDTSNKEELKSSLRPNTKAVYFETPANPSMKVIDIKNVADISHKINPSCLVVVDNTFSTPYITRPLSLGVDIVVHSATKYLNGHGDVVAGLSISNLKLISKIRSEGLKDITGAVMSPFDAFLVMRGLKTLKIRMEAHCSNAMKLALYLEKHEKVQRVFYPGLKSNEGYNIATSQMNLYGAVISFEVLGGFEAAKSLLNNLKICVLAVSLGDAETLIQHPASMTHCAYSKEEREAAGFSDGLIRLSVGLEDIDDIINDFEEALKRI